MPCSLCTTSRAFELATRSTDARAPVQIFPPTGGVSPGETPERVAAPYGLLLLSWLFASTDWVRVTSSASDDGRGSDEVHPDHHRREADQLHGELRWSETQALSVHAEAEHDRGRGFGDRDRWQRSVEWGGFERRLAEQHAHDRNTQQEQGRPGEDAEERTVPDPSDEALGDRVLKAVHHASSARQHRCLSSRLSAFAERHEQAHYGCDAHDRSNPVRPRELAGVPTSWVARRDERGEPADE